MPHNFKTMPDNLKEKTFLIRGLKIRVKCWNDEAPYKIIALHGWLDNAASFDVLSPKLIGCAVVAIDLPGQGLSDHRPLSATYHLWDDLVDILAVADELGWQEFAILGHSRGAMLSVILAASYPERVKRLILIDGLMPIPVKVENSPQQIRLFVDGYRKESTIGRLFSDRAAAVAARVKAGHIPEAVVELLAARQLQQTEAGWYWHVDSRLKAASALKLTSEHNASFLNAVECPVQVFLASEGFGSYQKIDGFIEKYKDFLWYKINGHHHLHMDKQAVEIARLCLQELF